MSPHPRHWKARQIQEDTQGQAGHTCAGEKACLLTKNDRTTSTNADGAFPRTKKLMGSSWLSIPFALTGHVRILYLHEALESLTHGSDCCFLVMTEQSTDLQSRESSHFFSDDLISLHKEAYAHLGCEERGLRQDGKYMRAPVPRASTGHCVTLGRRPHRLVPQFPLG